MECPAGLCENEEDQGTYRALEGLKEWIVFFERKQKKSYFWFSFPLKVLESVSQFFTLDGLYVCFNLQVLYSPPFPAQFNSIALKLKCWHYPSLMENEAPLYFMLECQFAINTSLIIKTDIWCPLLLLQGFPTRHTYLECVCVLCTCVLKLMADLSNCLKGIFFIYPHMNELLSTHFLPLEEPRSQPTNPTNQRDSPCIYHSNIWHT